MGSFIRSLKILPKLKAKLALLGLPQTPTLTPLRKSNGWRSVLNHCACIETSECAISVPTCLAQSVSRLFCTKYNDVEIAYENERDK